ncbi:AraC family transcriptional regulator [Aquimarina gracilis]|uniref:AraC family transcriptional regulator n=1 Tax=Aquimarina gracilis TaxID=874422 RepID=A0ABU6A0Q3_9FLAO|nr:AraC family transcriptional regulator [Aquimarina gracilis]MEB3347696.1 AraC family transcriptional regulator [Aquimarina gracilis]
MGRKNASGCRRDSKVNDPWGIILFGGANKLSKIDNSTTLLDLYLSKKGMVMSNTTQIERYKTLVEFLDQKFKEDISIKDIEDVSYYSYRNINRIFLALHHETIGKYIKRIKLEKAAQYLKYSDNTISDIAFEVGYSDIAAFSKAFKNQFNCNPSRFRETQELKQQIIQKAIAESETALKPSLEFEIEELPTLEILYLTYQGSFEDIKAIKKIWNKLMKYAFKKELIDDDSIFLAEILDDNEITDQVHCRYNAGIVIESPLQFKPKGLFRTKIIPSQKYAKFLHRGSHEDSLLTYDYIYSNWISEIDLELEDKPTLEFFLNDEEDTAPEELLTEIYIPIK